MRASIFPNITTRIYYFTANWMHTDGHVYIYINPEVMNLYICMHHGCIDTDVYTYILFTWIYTNTYCIQMHTRAQMNDIALMRHNMMCLIHLRGSKYISDVFVHMHVHKWMRLHKSDMCTNEWDCISHIYLDPHKWIRHIRYIFRQTRHFCGSKYISDVSDSFVWV